VFLEPRPHRGEDSLALGLLDRMAFAIVNGAFVRHVVFIEHGFEVRRLLRAPHRVGAAVQDQEWRADLFRLRRGRRGKTLFSATAPPMSFASGEFAVAWLS
jgi:hypothetical protein